MRPFFSYYGAKYTCAGYLGKPKHNVVVEPFAGSACFSTRWNVDNVFLYDISEDICSLWDFLINCSDNDIKNIPSNFNDFSEIKHLPRGAELLVRFWIAKGRAEPSGKLSPWYAQYKGSNDCRVWGEKVKSRILTQKPFIKNWKIDCLDYKAIPKIEAHWHIDPPYNNYAGSRYPNSDLNYKELADWCKSLPGFVQVCENDGADWLDFKPLCEVASSRGRKSGYKSKEVFFEIDNRIGDQ